MKATQESILAVIRNGNRIDRFIYKGDDGQAYISTADISLDRIYTKGPVSLYIPVSYELTETQEMALASDLWLESKKLQSGCTVEDHNKYINSFGE